MAMALVESAVHRQGADRKEALLDRLFAFWFDRFVYNQIWEDPEIDLEALEIDPSCRIVTIASGGCNVLNYLTADPAAIVAVDLNPAHVALARLKLGALRHLPHYNAFVAFFGSGADKGNVGMFDACLRWKIDPETREYWEKRSLTGRRRIECFTDGLYRAALLGRFIGFLHGLARLLGKRPERLLAARTIEEQRAVFAAEIAPLFDNRLVRALSRQRMLLYSLGIPPHQFDSLQEVSGGDLAALYRDRLRRLACGFPLAENYFAWQAFGRRYDTANPASLPQYLRPESYALLRERVDRVAIQTVSMTDFLRAEPDRSCDRYVLLDSVDWMDEATLARLWGEIDRTARPGARVIFRTAGARSPLETLLPEEALAGWRREAETAARLFERDRSAIYGGFHLYVRA